MTNFPIQYLKPEYSAISFFSAAFGGANDIHHLYKSGLRNVLMIDTNNSMLIGMSETFGYSYLCEDAYGFLNSTSMNEADVIVCDQWTGQDDMINRVYFDRLLSLAKKVLIVGISQTYIDSQKEKPPGEYFKRSDFNGGVYWRVVSK